MQRWTEVVEDPKYVARRLGRDNCPALEELDHLSYGRGFPFVGRSLSTANHALLPS